MASKIWGGKTKKEVLAEYHRQLFNLQAAIAMNNRYGIIARLRVEDIPEPKSLKQVNKILSDISTAAKSIMVDVKTGNVISITKPSKYIEIATYKERYRGNKKYILESDYFTTEQVSEILKQQAYTNKEREKFNLTPVSGIYFKKGTPYNQIIQTIARAGSSEVIVARIYNSIANITKSMSVAIHDIDKTQYSSDYKQAMETLVDVILQEVDTNIIGAWEKLNRVFNKVGSTDFNLIYRSDQYEVFSNSTLIDELMSEFGVIFKVKEGEDKTEKKYDYTNVRW